MAFIFPPFADRQRFPILASLVDDESLITHLMAFDDLAFLAPENVAKADLIGRSPGLDWHEYGDTRWDSSVSWVEFPVTHLPQFVTAGAIIARCEIPLDEHSPLEWAAHNHPLSPAIRSVRATSQMEQLAELLQSKSGTFDVPQGLSDIVPRYIQSYILYGKSKDGAVAREFAIYTDILNQDGIPIPDFRTARFTIHNVSWCRGMMSALFHLNRARLNGKNFVVHLQLPVFEPYFIDSATLPPKWTAFHPCRTLRTRPAVRSRPRPELLDGLMFREAYEQLVNSRRMEVSRELLAFERDVRPRDLGSMNLDSNSSITAFLHRENGAAIYVLPERLVDEFDKTDCSEVMVGDLDLPFPSLYLKFTPPHPLSLSEDAIVDGCYVVRQGHEILLTLTSRQPDIDYEKSSPMTCLDPTFSLHLPAEVPEMSITDSVQSGVAEFLARNAPPEEDLSQAIELPDGLHTELVDVRAENRRRRIEVFRSQQVSFEACLNIIVNAACFISFRPDDIEDSWEGTPPHDVLRSSSSDEITRRGRDRRSAALRRIENGDFTKIKICGSKLFEDHCSHSEFPTGRSIRAHWRRGHWRRQKVGANLARIELRWIRPTLVKRDSGSPAETRIYDID
jgi:hypothetical protein